MSPLVARAVTTAVETAWAAIRTHHRQIPPALAVLAHQQQISPPEDGGHLAPCSWTGPQSVRDEVTIPGEVLGLGAEQVLNVLLHQAAHALAARRKVKDTSRHGRYHKRMFAELASEVGLVPAPPCSGWGWVSADVGGEAAERYATVLAALDDALTVPPRSPGCASARHLRPAGNGGLPLSCRCSPPRVVWRMTVSTVTEWPILCGGCAQPFRGTEIP